MGVHYEAFGSDRNARTCDLGIGASAISAGMEVRPDRSANASDPDGAGAIKFATMGTGFHATNPQAATYWNPANTATGTYTTKGTCIFGIRVNHLLEVHVDGFGKS